MSGRHVLAALVLIVFATAILPPAAAVAVNRSRVRSASATVAMLAQSVRDREDWITRARAAGDVLCSSGRMPLASASPVAPWVNESRSAWPAQNAATAPPPDPWGNCYVVNLAASDSPGAIVWVLSAGPDGMIDTAFASADGTTAGDDIAVRIR